MTDEKQNLYAMMYGADDELDETEQPSMEEPEEMPEFRTAGHVVGIKVGDKTVAVPRLTYMRELQASIAEIKRDVRRLQANNRHLLRAIKQLSSERDQLESALNNKIDRRE
jgi:hypothetical protein